MRSDEAFWTKAARKYAAAPISDMAAYEYTLARTKTYLNPTHRVLEIGCGTGNTAAQLAPFVGHIVATDFSKGMIDIAHERVADAGLANMTCRVASPADAALGQEFDAVLAHNLLHLIEDVDATLAHVYQAVRPGGVFISKTVTTPNGAMPFKIRMMLWVLPLAQKLGKAPFVRFDSIADLEARIVNAGFEIVEALAGTGAPPSQYVVARRPA